MKVLSFSVLKFAISIYLGGHLSSETYVVQNETETAKGKMADGRMEVLWTRDQGVQLKPLDLRKCLDDTPEFRSEIQQHEVSLSDDTVSCSAR